MTETMVKKWKTRLATDVRRRVLGESAKNASSSCNSSTPYSKPYVIANWGRLFVPRDLAKDLEY